MRYRALAFVLLSMTPCWGAESSELSARLSGVPNLCGNGQIGAGEQCDDGNTFDDDCCSAECQFNPANPRCNGAVSFTPSSQAAGPFAHFVAGWEFTPQTALTVVGLGVYDRDSDGFVDVHEVGLWRATGELEASVFIPALSTAPLAGRFRFRPIEPVALIPGQRYVVAALYHQHVIEWWAEGREATFDPRIQFETGREQYQVAGLQLPTEIEETARLGPSLLLVGQCGDGVVDGGEECDDGNMMSEDGCSSACIIDAPTPTATSTASPTATATPTATVTTTATSTATATEIATATAPAGTPMTTATVAFSPSPSPSPTIDDGPECAGDCSGDGVVRINELIAQVSIALGRAPIDECPAGDGNGDGRITIGELITAVTRALQGCG